MRCEARPKTPCKVRESRDDFVDPARSRIAERASREWREPRAENDPGVDEIGIRRYAFVQAGDRFVD